MQNLYTSNLLLDNISYLVLKGAVDTLLTGNETILIYLHLELCAIMRA
jgi:hypothetical protein